MWFDLETCSADELFRRPDFVRLCGAMRSDRDEVGITSDPAKLLGLLRSAGEVTGHNILGFDLLALAFHCGADWEELAAKARDTEILARLADPPRSRGAYGSADRYTLDAVAERLGVPGKTDDIKSLEKRHGGFDMIPVDDPDYRAYLEGDVRATRAVADLLPMTDYGRREHRLAVLAGRMTLNGFRVDVPLLRRRIAEGAARKAEALESLSGSYGLPLGRETARGRGAARKAVWEPHSSPLATTEGLDWLAGIWQRFGVVRPPLTRTGRLSTSAGELRTVSGHPRCPEELKAVLASMEVVTTTRTVYQTAANHLVGDRVHPLNGMRQASGRWSVTSPGLTVFGKQGGKHVERDVFVPEPGHVLISCDLAQVDMRAVAGHCQDPAYMALFAPGKDVHQEIADQLGISRFDAKAIGHGYNYGMGRRKAKASGIDPDLVDRFYDGMAASFGTKDAWTASVREQAEAGVLLDNGFGRKMRCDPQYAYTAGPALMGQGTARDITCGVLLRLMGAHPEYAPYLRAYVHDEFVFSVPEEQAEEIGAEIKHAFTWEWRGVPILCDLAGPGTSWGAISEK